MQDTPGHPGKPANPSTTLIRAPKPTPSVTAILFPHLITGPRSLATKAGIRDSDLPEQPVARQWYPQPVHRAQSVSTSDQPLKAESCESSIREPRATPEDLPYNNQPCAGNRARPAVPSGTAEARVRQHTRGRAEGRQTRVQRRLQQHQPVRRNADGHDKPPQASEQREQAEVGDSDRVSRSSSSGSSS